MFQWNQWWDMVRALVTCNHSRALGVEGKTYCPDCGEGIVYRWTVLRCAGCEQRRPGQYLFRKVVPQQRCCTFCGEVATRTEYLSDPEFYQLRHALLSCESANDGVGLMSSIRAMVDGCLKPEEPLKRHPMPAHVLLTTARTT